MPQRENAVPKPKVSAFKPPSLARKDSSAGLQPKSSIAKAKKPLNRLDSSDEAGSSEDIDSASDIVVAPNSQEASLTIPSKLLTKLLHHHFEDDKIRLDPDANVLVGKYMETFVREALARAAYERSRSSEGGIGADFLEVSGELIMSSMFTSGG